MQGGVRGEAESHSEGGWLGIWGGEWETRPVKDAGPGHGSLESLTKEL